MRVAIERSAVARVPPAPFAVTVQRDPGQPGPKRGRGPPVAADATIYVLESKGYTKAREGRNGFTCLISRQRPDTLEPECFDAVGTASVVPVRMFVEGIVYMLSPHNYVFDPERKQVIRFPGHLMSYAPYATQKDVGSGSGGSLHRGAGDTSRPHDRRSEGSLTYARRAGD